MTTLAPQSVAPLTTGIPPQAALLARAAAMVPRLRERARQAEAERCIPAETIRELIDANLLEVQKPARFGGYELGLSWGLVGTMWGQHALGLPLSSAAY